METNANDQTVRKDKTFVPGGIAGKVHENAMQEEIGKSKFHPFVLEKVHPIILNIYKDYSVKGYFIMILVSFLAIAVVVAIALGIYLAATR